MKDKIIVKKMITYIGRILGYIQGYDYDRFSKEQLAIDACVFNLSQIGELVTKVSENFEQAHPEIPWRQLYGLRNRIVHDYEGVNIKLVWEIVENDLKGLLSNLEKIE